ncbi:phosphotransferase family protein [Bacillus sp. WLY-B-L8]|uniref:phosphotransferase family protein n=1 Tax=Bacillus multifaciens TaxID=3068506 RepID=UPI002741D0DB|nr:phosphotransferase [Bacillus sp. WLY-B-L8]MDP7977886.1 phosphotransferase [Bacillus sp. WLY-B-L8]
MVRENEYVQYLEKVYPNLDVQTAYVNDIGQNNDVLIVNENIVFRFPKYEEGIAKLIAETKLLEKIQNYVSLSIPCPSYQHFQPMEPGKVFSDYNIINGEPFWNTTFLQLYEEEQSTGAAQLANFLKELHSIPVLEISPLLKGNTADIYSEIENLYFQLKEKLFSYMKESARQDVSQSFEAYLSDDSHFTFQPCLIHGDFGMTNILYDGKEKRISGIIDFGGAGIGDPAYDFAGLLSSYGSHFLEGFSSLYPNFDQVMDRMNFYRSTFALQEALFGLRNNDRKAFEQGIKDYI